MKILINVTNARNVGGGLQVVCNFLRGTQKYVRPDIEWYYAVSECLDEVYLDDTFKNNAQGRYSVFPNQPDFKGTYLRVQNELRELEDRVRPDVIYTILGPSYNFFKSREVIRFVHPWVVTSNEFAWRTLPWRAKIRMRLHIILLKLLLHRIKFIVTQTETVKLGLVEEIHINPDNIKVVKNVLPEVYSTLENSHIHSDGDWVEIAAVGAGYHKNLDIIPEVLNSLKKEYGITNYRFHITLPEHALGLERISNRLKELDLEKQVINHGNLKQENLAELYRNCDACFLPTVLEVFSASTIEAMYFRLPTVATSLPFNTEVMKDSCLYYSPMDAKDAARQLVKIITDLKLRQDLIDKMQSQLTQFSDFSDYFNSTVDFLVKVGHLK